jgi:O-antigen/teichoic acid export membrane protein
MNEETNVSTLKTGKRAGLPQRLVTALSWTVAANLLVTAMLFIRSIWLARLLPIETFGIYTGVQAVVGVSVVLVGFGMAGAFLHRTAVTQDEGYAAAVYFTLQLLFLVVWAVVMLIIAGYWLQGESRLALGVLTATTIGTQITDVPRSILARRVVHRRLALVQVVQAGASTVVAVLLAQAGYTLWALLATDIVGMVIMIGAMYTWRPVWRPHLVWHWATVRYYLSFGSKNVLSSLLTQLLDQADNLWVRLALGTTALGYYSRAYTFATYPRKILSGPISGVAGGAYAELKADQLRLSQLFFRTNALLVRSGFFITGILALVAPEFIRLVIGEKWLPMLGAFRLLLLFALLDPINTTLAALFMAVGKPGQLLRIRFTQVVVLLIGLFMVGPLAGILGVALAVNVTVVVGILLLFHYSRRYVDYSALRLFAAPGIALGVGALAARLALFWPGVQGADWRTGLVKIVIFAGVYVTILLIAERRQLETFVLRRVREQVGKS